MKKFVGGMACGCVILAAALAGAGEPIAYQKGADWQTTLVSAREAVRDFAKARSFKPFHSRVMVKKDAAQPISVDVTGVERIWLQVTDANNAKNGSGVFADVKLIAKDGTQTPADKLPWVESVGGPAHDDIHFDKNFEDKPLKIGKKEIPKGFLIPAPGWICYDLDKKYVRLEASVGVDESIKGDKHQVQFHVLDIPREPELAFLDFIERDFSVQWDWAMQDHGVDFFQKFFAGDANMVPNMARKAVADLGPAGAALNAELLELVGPGKTVDEVKVLGLYARACQQRRALRLASLAGKKVVFTKHINLGGSHYAYTEALSDGAAERQFHAGASLCLLEMDGTEPKVRTLLSDANGMIRDPAVSYDGKRILFAWKKSDRQDDYHLHEMDVATGAIRQLTFGLGFADYEGTYMPSGDIVFNSTRCVQTVDCFPPEVSNLFTCNKDGRFLRRVTFDQVHDNYPTVLDDGRVIYTRWEYSDRGQIYVQGLFQMNPDGTGQTAAYGNNSWFPTTIMHARGIAGTPRILAVLSGHHSRQTGKLAIIDPSQGHEENAGVQLVAPVRETPAVKVDAYGQDGELFQYPYPLSDTEFLVTYHPLGWGNRNRRARGAQELNPHFGIYYMNIEGRRELLASDREISCNQPVLLAERPAPKPWPTQVDYTQNTGTFYMQDVYEGPGLKGVQRGSIKKLRVVAIGYRAYPLGSNNNGGEAGGAMVTTPPSINNGSWDTKIVLGEATVYEDGSALFEVPARTPVYFQAIDSNGHVAQTMRSWATLQPGERSACVGCHETKTAAPPAGDRVPLAMKAGKQTLMPFYGPARGFSFVREIQPILDRNCVFCHKDRTNVDDYLGDRRGPAKPPSLLRPGAFSLTGEITIDSRAKRRWSDSYLRLTCGGLSTPLVNWISAQSRPPMLPPYFAGAAKSGLITMLQAAPPEFRLSQEEMDKLACWIDLLVPYCGDYKDGNMWTPDEAAKYDRLLAKRARMEEIEKANIAEMLGSAGVADAGTQVHIEICDAAGKVAAETSAAGSAVLAVDRPFQPGDRILVTGPKQMIIRLDASLAESCVVVPTGKLEFPVTLSGDPNQPQKGKVYPPECFLGTKHVISARALSKEEQSGYRNVALNPYDVRGDAMCFPHATSNSECRNEPVFAARTAIDGFAFSKGHGGFPKQSWGPEQRKDLWWQVDLGRLVDVDKVVITIRADFPHDKFWKSATLKFSDGSSEKITIRKAAEGQTFTFKKRSTTFVKIDELVQDEPMGWCALSEVEVWGQ